MATRVVITDAYSSLGQALLKGFEPTHFSMLVPRPESLDWCDLEAVREYLDDNAPEIIINTLGWAEFPSIEEQEVIVQAAEVLGAAARDFPCSVIHLSSFRVFGGENKSSYDEQDRPSPLSNSGRAFWSAERSLILELERVICLRVGWLLDLHSDTVFKRVLDGLMGEEALAVTESRTGAPLNMTSVAKVVVSLVQQILCGAENWGVIHYASGDACSVAELAEVLAAHLRDDHGISKNEWLCYGDDEVLEVSTWSQEPVSGVLTMRRCRDDFGVQAKSWRQGLGALVAQYLEESRLEI